MGEKRKKLPEVKDIYVNYIGRKNALECSYVEVYEGGIEKPVSTSDLDEIVRVMKRMSAQKRTSLAYLIANDAIVIDKSVKASDGIVLPYEVGSVDGKKVIEYHKYFFDLKDARIFRQGEKVEKKAPVRKVKEKAAARMTGLNTEKVREVLTAGVTILAGTTLGVTVLCCGLAVYSIARGNKNTNTTPNKTIEEQESNEANKNIEINGVSFSDPVEEAEEAQEVVVPARDINIDDFGGSIREFNQYSLTQIKKACADGIECRFWKFVPDEDQETVQFINDVRNDFSNGRISSNSLMNYYLNYFNGASFKNNSNYKQFYELTTLGKLAVIISSKTILPYVDNQFSAKISGVECNKYEIEDLLNAIYEAYNADFEAENGYGGKYN